jgi:hypothetical protein
MDNIHAHALTFMLALQDPVIGTGVLDEAEPLEKEVAIDPEMLGKAFKNSIEENRRKSLASFYTPREIVHRMCIGQVFRSCIVMLGAVDLN